MRNGTSSVERNVLSGFAAALGVLATLVFLAWQISVGEEAADREFRRVLDLHGLIKDVKGESYLIELNSQNFRLSSDPQFLADRNRAMAARELQLRRMERAIGRDPAHQEGFSRLQAVAGERLAIAREIERLLKAEGRAAADAYAHAMAAPLRETRLRLAEILDGMEQESKRELDARLAILQKARERQRLIDLVALLLTGAALTALYLLLRRQIRAAARAQRHLHEAVQAIPEGFAIYDADDRLMLCNSRYREIYGLDEDIVGERFEDTLRRGLARGTYPAARGREAAWLAERLAAHRDPGPPIEQPLAGERWLRISECRLSDGSTAGLRMDITALKHAQAAAQEAQRAAEEASRAKSAFLAAMSHEIRTPMNGVIGMVDLLRQTSLKGHQIEMVDTIRESAYALLGIIEDILDFSKIEAGRLEIELLPTDLATVADRACLMLDTIASRKNVELTLFADPALPRVWCDAARLRQIVVNLAGNAIKFSSASDRGGKVAVRLELRERGAQRVVVDLSVRDNGIGMDADAQARLFKAFSQADASTTRRFGGTGLGLAIVRKLVDLMGGDIRVDSAPGQGATFTVNLPLALADEGNEGGDGPPPLPLAGLDCLVVGEAGLADDWACYARAAGAAVRRAPTLAAALALAPPAGQTALWVIDADGAEEEALYRRVQEIAAAAGAGGSAKLRFLLIGHGRRRRLRQIGAAPPTHAIDVNVLTRTACLAALAVAAGRAEPEADDEADDREAGRPTPPSRGEALLQGRLILVVEDNEINQQVIARQLALLGYAADVAGNGLEALERLGGADYALVLTDLHMPAMDGYELTMAERSRERVHGGRRVPIVALTANALKGEAQRCRAAGMDDYLSKPVALDELKAMLDKWLAPAAAAAAELAVPDLPGGPAVAVPNLPGGPAIAVPPAPTFQAALPVFRADTLAALVGDDPGIIDAFLADFCRSAQTLVAQIAADPARAGPLAHQLKSSARAVGALALGARCEQIEATAKDGDPDALAPLCAALAEEFAAARQAIEAHRAGGK